eukprot:scaffold303787_cov31-Tisochrysis_lutea.AAC.2
MVVHRVFVYGSLLRGLHNHHRLGSSSILVGEARTAHPYVLIDSGHGYPFALNAACARAVDLPAPLVGEVYEVTDDVLYNSLDPLEDHPDIYRRREVDLADGAGRASLYLLENEQQISAITSDTKGVIFVPSKPAGDWRSHLQGARSVSPWPDTRRTLTEPGPHAVFSYGCNGLDTLRQRCRNPSIRAVAAELRGAIRVFGGYSERWRGAVASVSQKPGGVIYGNVAFLSNDDLKLLDEFETTFTPDPYSEKGVYRRQDVTVYVGSQENGGRPTPIPAMVYVCTDTAWMGPPSQEYLDACATNVRGFWDDELAFIEVLDENGEEIPTK